MSANWQWMASDVLLVLTRNDSMLDDLETNVCCTMMVVSDVSPDLSSHARVDVRAFLSRVLVRDPCNDLRLSFDLSHVPVLSRALAFSLVLALFRVVSLFQLSPSRALFLALGLGYLLSFHLLLSRLQLYFRQSQLWFLLPLPLSHHLRRPLLSLLLCVLRLVSTDRPFVSRALFAFLNIAAR